MKIPKIISVLFIAHFFCLFALAQTPCTPETAYQTVGNWRRGGADDLAMADSSFPRIEQKTVLSKAQQIIELFKATNLSLKGVDAKAYRTIRGKSYFPNGALKFAVTIGFFEYFCNPSTSGYMADLRGKVMPGGEYGTLINVYFNDFGWALKKIESEGDFLTANGEPLFFQAKPMGDFNGATLLQGNGGRLDQKQEAVILTSNGRLPYKPVTREQFIQSKIKYYQEFYQPDRRASFAPIIAELDSMLAKMSSAEKQMQAIVRDPFEKKDRLFTIESNGGKPVVAIDKEFFNPKSPRSVIQFITVYWGWDDKNPVVKEIIGQFKQNFNFIALKQMLGK